MDSPSGIRECITELMVLSPSGFAIALHIEFTTPSYLFQTYPKAWIDYYSQNGLVMQDPTVAWGFDNVGVIRWSELVENDPGKVIEKAAEYGILCGFTYSVQQSGSQSLCSFTSPDADFSDAQIAEICKIVDRMHESTLSLAALSEETRRELKRMSIVFTHP